jgi:hypothetical protein
MAMAAMSRLVAIGRRMKPSEMFTSVPHIIWSFSHPVIVDELLNFSIEQR